MSRRLIAGTGEHADRVALLGAIEQRAPEVLATLGELLTPERRAWLARQPRTPSRWSGPELAELGADVLAWADRWNLARVEEGRTRGGWVVESALRTLHFWTVRLSHVVPREELPARGWANFSGGGGWRGGRPGRAAPLPVCTEANKRGGWANGWRARAKREMGDSVKHLRTTEDWRMAAFVLWQVRQAPTSALRILWEGWRPRSADPTHADRAIRDAMETLRERLDLPSRRARPGRPRRAGR